MKKNNRKQMEEQLHIKKERGRTFTGFRPTVMEDKRHKNMSRQSLKRELDNLIDDLSIENDDYDDMYDI